MDVGYRTVILAMARSRFSRYRAFPWGVWGTVPSGHKIKKSHEKGLEKKGTYCNIILFLERSASHKEKGASGRRAVIALRVCGLSSGGNELYSIVRVVLIGQTSKRRNHVSAML